MGLGTQVPREHKANVMTSNGEVFVDFESLLPPETVLESHLQGAVRSKKRS